MRQLTFEVIYDGFTEEIIHLEESIKVELLSQMTSAIIEVFKNERREADGNLSEQ